MTDKRPADESPYEPPVYAEPMPSKRGDAGDRLGINLRLLDNLLQAACIAVSTFIGGIGGALSYLPDGPQGMVPGAILGSVLGLLTGLLGSGIFLMFYRSGRGSRRSAE